VFGHDHKQHQVQDHADALREGKRHESETDPDGIQVDSFSKT
jgi:hypothetical protein